MFRSEVKPNPTTSEDENLKTEKKAESNVKNFEISVDKKDSLEKLAKMKLTEDGHEISVTERNSFGGQQEPDGHFQLFLSAFLQKPFFEKPLVRALISSKIQKVFASNNQFLNLF